MKRIALTLGVTGVVIIIGLVFTNRALAEQPCAPIPQDDPPYSLDGAWVSGIEGSLGTDAEGTLSIVPSGFPPSRMTEGDIEGMTGWELAAGHIGVPGIDNGTVLALVFDGAGRVYAGGTFENAGGVEDADYLARWTRPDGWSAIGGVDGPVRALAVRDEWLYVGGDFTNAGGIATADFIARWRQSGWEPLGSRINGPVHAIALDGNGDVYVGGEFLDDSPDWWHPMNYVARWNGISWANLKGGVDGPVRALTLTGDGLFVGGDFERASMGKHPFQAMHIARWDGSWHTVSDVLQVQWYVDALAARGDTLYVATTHGSDCGFHIFEVTGVHGETAAWRELAESATCEVDRRDRIYSLAAGQTSLFAAGRFDTITGTVAADWIAAWHPRQQTWSPLGDGILDSTDPADGRGVYALALDGPSLYAGGVFTEAGGAATQRVARWMQPVADLGLTTAITPSRAVRAGEQITYGITLIHHGYHEATGVRLTDTLPVSVSFESASGGGAYSGSAHGVTWDWANLGPATRLERQVVGLVQGDVPTGTRLVNQVAVAADQYDPALSAPFPANNTVSDTAEVQAVSVLSLSKRAPKTADVGKTLVYTLVVSNTGPSDASHVTLVDTLPSGVYLDGHSPECAGDDEVVTCELAGMPAAGHGSVQTVTIQVVPRVLGLVTNTATVTAPEALSAAVATATTEISGTVGLSVMKNDGVVEVGLNEPLTYTIRAWNTGQVTIGEVVVTDTLPSSVALRAVRVSKGSCSGSSVLVCDVGSLGSGEEVEIAVGVTATAEGLLHNVVEVDGEGVERQTEDDDTLVVDEADLRLTKTGPAHVTTGEDFDYEITVVNLGPAAASDVLVTDDLPDGLSLNDAQSTAGDCVEVWGPESARVTCDLGELAVGESARVVLNVVGLTPQPDGVANTATVAAATSDPDPENNAQDSEIVVYAGPLGTRSVGDLTIEAYVFRDLPGGRTQAHGVVSLGDHFRLGGLNDSVLFDSDTLTGTGELVLKEGNLSIFGRDFVAAAPAFELSLDDGEPSVPQLANFRLDWCELTLVNLLTGVTMGQTDGGLRLDPPGSSVMVSADFTIRPGPVFNGSIPEPFSLDAGSFTLDVPAGASLSDYGVEGDPVELALPDYFGGGVVADASVRIYKREGAEHATLEVNGAAGAGFPLPDLLFDSQSTLKLINGRGTLLNAGGVYAIKIADSKLVVNLAGHAPVTVTKPGADALGTVWLQNGQIGTDPLPPFGLKVAGGTLTIDQAWLTNGGLQVTNAVYEWPENLGGRWGNVADAPNKLVEVSAGGAFTVSGNSDIPLPDILILGGEWLQVKDVVADLVKGPNGYGFHVTGGKVRVSLRQQNDHLLHLAEGEVSVDGHFRGRMVEDTLTLDVAGAELTISGLSSGWPLNDTMGLTLLPNTAATGALSAADETDAWQGKWELPARLGGGTKTFNAPIVIDGAGLHINNGSPVPFPDANLDDGGFPLLNNVVTLGTGGDRTYELNVSGGISVTIPGFAGLTEGDLVMDSLGNLTGSADGLDMLIGGLELGVNKFVVEGGQLLTNGGTFSAPPGFGGDQVTLNGMGILDFDAGLIGWGMDEHGNVTSATVQLPSLELNGTELFALEGSFRLVDRLPIEEPDGEYDGYEIYGRALAEMPGMPGTSLNTKSSTPDPDSDTFSCSGFEVEVRLEIGLDGETHAYVAPAGYLCKMMPADEQTRDLEVAGAGSLRLIHVYGRLSCSIPIHELGINIGNPRLLGGWDGYQDLVYMGGGFSVWTMMEVLGHAVATGDVDVYMEATPDWATWDVTGTVTILDIWEAARAHGRVGFREDAGIPYPHDLGFDFKKTQIFNVAMIPIPVTASGGFHVWTDWTPADPQEVDAEDFHFTGWAALVIGLEKGTIGEECVAGVCVQIPPWEMDVEADAEFGQFRNNGGSVWGVKAEVEVFDIFETGIYIDVDGNLDFGDVDEYVLLDSAQMQRIYEGWLAMQEGRVAATAIERDVRYDLYTFSTETIERDVDVATPRDMVFALSRSGPVPTMTLRPPSGVEITPQTTLPNVTVTTSYSPAVPYTQTTYFVGDAEAGTWKVILQGDIGTDDTYVLQVLGADPSPTLTNVDAVSTGPTSAQASWRLASDEVTTTLNIHAAPGPITRSLTVSHTDGTTETVTREVYVDGPVLLDAPTGLNGAPGSAALDLSHLPSGRYWVWLEANDGRNPPVRVHAPEPIDVAQVPPASWTPVVTVTPDYLGLQIEWDPLVHPDVDGYTVFVYDAPPPGPPGAGCTAVITTPFNATFVSTWLDPGRTYYVVIQAYDVTDGWRLQSPTASGEPLPAAFSLTTTTPEITMTGGGSTSLDVALVRTGDMTPTVGLYLADLPDGIDVAFTGNRWLTPTLVPGTTASLVLTATDTLPGGVYTVTIAGFGGGGLATLGVRVLVEEPTFELAASPHVIDLMMDGAATVTVSALRYSGESDPIHLDVVASPGLGWGLSTDVLQLGDTATLHVTDTLMVSHGAYELLLIGDDGENTFTLTVPLTVTEPGFHLSADPIRCWILAGETVLFPIHVTPRDGWTDPVTVRIDPSWLPPGSTGGFVSGPADSPQTEVTVAPPETVYLSVRSGDETPDGLYLLRAEGSAGAGGGGGLVVQGASGGGMVVVHLDLELGVADAGANLSLQKTVDDRTPSAGWDVVYAITLTNHGPEYASSIVISDALPISMTYKADDGAGAYDPLSGAWSVSGLRADASTTLHITATVDPGADDGVVIVNTAAYSEAAQIELDPHDNQAQAALAVAGADLRVEKGVDNLIPREGEEIVYAVTVTNLGNASTVVVSDVLPGGLTYVDHGGPGSYTPATGAWSLGMLTEGMRVTLHITAVVEPGTRGLQIVNTATVSSTSRIDPYPGDDSASASITAQHPDAVIVTLTPGEGGTLTYADSRGLATTVVVPPGAVSETVTLVMSPVPTPTQTGGLSFAGHAFDLTIFQGGAPVPGYVFLTPIRVTIEYCDADVVGLLEEQLELQHWNGTTWVNAACGPCDRHPEENWICVPVQHLTRFSLFGRRVPVGGVTRPVPPPDVCLGALAAAGLAALVFTLQKRRVW